MDENEENETGGSEKGLDLGLAGGLVFSLISVIAGLYLEGSSVGKYIGPSAFLIVIGGTFGVTTASVGLERALAMPKSFMRALTTKPASKARVAYDMLIISERARREGLLAIEDDIQALSNPFLQRGMQLVVDGMEAQQVEAIMDGAIETQKTVDTQAATAWDTAGGFSPTLGIIGTVIGLVLVLSNISDPSSLAASIAVAFIATLYGVGSANLVFLPTANRLKGLRDQMSEVNTLALEAMLSIQAGDNPRVLEEKLISLMTEKEQAQFRRLQNPDGEEDDE